MACRPKTRPGDLRTLLALASLLAVAACGDQRPPADRTRAADLRRLRPQAECYDPSALPSPWKLFRTGPDFIEFRARTADLGLAAKRDSLGDPPQQQEFVTVTTSCPWDPATSAYLIADPQRIDENIASGLFKPAALPGRGDDLQAFEGGAVAYYISRDRNIQCLDRAPRDADSWPNPYVECRIISPDHAWVGAFTIPAAARPQLSASVALISELISRTARGSAAPAQRSAASPGTVSGRR